MNLNFLVKKKHIFKKRKAYPYKPMVSLNLNCGIYTINFIRFELVYLKTFKKVFRKKYFKRKTSLMGSKFWLMIKPNFLLTIKSKNSRMGSGVGTYVRVCSLVKPNRPVILFKNYSTYIVSKVVKYLKLKLNINLYFNSLKKLGKTCIN